MSDPPQLFEIIVAGLIAGFTTFIASFVIFDYALVVGMTSASAYYFSRYPWGSQEGDKYNKKIDEYYREYLPF